MNDTTLTTTQTQPQPAKPAQKSHSHRTLIIALIFAVIITVAAIVIMCILLGRKAQPTVELTESAPTPIVKPLPEYSEVTTPGQPDPAGEYLYKIRYDFGQDSYIYLMEDQTIKIVAYSPIYDTVPDCLCMEFTGKYQREETIVDFDAAAKAKAVAVFDELATKAGSNDFNADKMELSSYQQLVLLATTLSFRDYIMLDDELQIKTNTNGSIKYDIIITDTSNETVTKVAEYLNPIIEADIQQLANVSALKLKIAYIGPFSFSVVYNKVDKDGHIIDTQGYTFHSTGDIHPFDMRGWMDEYHEKAVASFKQSSNYIKYGDELESDWEDILEQHMFEIGNWYETEMSTTFIIPAKTLGITSLGDDIISIKIDIDEEY